MSRASRTSGRLVALRADDPVFWLHRGQDLLLRDRPAEAGRCFDIALTTAPDDVAALNARARSHFILGELEPALVLLDAAAELDPGLPEIWNNRGVILTRLGRLAEARGSFAKGLALAPGDPGILLNRALTLLVDGDAAGALADLDRTVEALPEAAEPWRHKGFAHLKLGQVRQARQALLFAARRTWAEGGSRRRALACLALGGTLGLCARLGLGEDGRRSA